jgi:hypothetical protein
MAAASGMRRFPRSGESEGRLRGSLLPERHVRLHAADQSRPARFVVSLALLQIESGFSALDLSAGALRLDTRLRALI